MKDYYKILGIQVDATLEDIKNAYKSLAKKFHPDKVIKYDFNFNWFFIELLQNKDPGAEEKFKEIAEAYEILSNQLERIEYNRYAKNKKN